MDDTKSLVTPEEASKFPKGMRWFLTAAYLVEIEHRTYALQRDLIVQYFDKSARKEVREKLKTIGPIGLFRECEGEEAAKPDLRTIHPKTMKELLLKNIGEI